MTGQLMEEALSPENWHAAWNAVAANGGAPGIGGMKCAELVGHLQWHGEAIAAKMLGSPVRHPPYWRTILSAVVCRPNPTVGAAS